MKQSSTEALNGHSKYTKELIKMFGLEKGKAFGTPMSPSTCLETDVQGKYVDKKCIEQWLDHYYILLQVDLTSCSVYVNVQGFKQLQKNHI